MEGLYLHVGTCVEPSACGLKWYADEPSESRFATVLSQLLIDFSHSHDMQAMLRPVCPHVYCYRVSQLVGSSPNRPSATRADHPARSVSALESSSAAGSV